MDSSYLRSLGIRTGSFILIIILSIIFHRFFARMDEEVIGAVCILLIFTLGLLFYYIRLFKEGALHKLEFLIGIVLIYFMTIGIFALIYAEPINSSSDYFMKDGVRSTLSFSDAFYFSTTTITTLGYGDIVPRGIFRIIIVIELFFGLVYTGLLVYYITKVLEHN
jgi:potassium channel LctB